MLPRQSIDPLSGNGSQRRKTATTSSSTLKSRQLAYLNAQLAQLQSNVLDLGSHVQVSVEHAESIRKLGILHGALLMATHKVFEQEDIEEGDEIAEQRE